VSFIAHARNIVFVSPAGIGESHISIAAGLKACARRKRVLFTSAMTLLDQMVASVLFHTQRNTLETLGRLDLLILDELGYMPIDSQRGNFFFRDIKKVREGAYNTVRGGN